MSLATNSGVSNTSKSLYSNNLSTHIRLPRRVVHSYRELLSFISFAVMLILEVVGHSVIPRDLACCEVTIKLPSFTATANSQRNCRESVLVVDDLTEHPDLKNRPYVTGFPNGRYYAGVPITVSHATRYMKLKRCSR